MTIRMRVAVLLAGCFVVAGAVVLAVGAAAYQQAVYQSPGELTDEVLDRLGVTREQARAYLQAHPDAILALEDGSPTTDAREATNAAFRDAQSDAQDTLLGRSRRWTIAALVAMSAAAAIAGWIIASRALAPLRLVTARARAAAGGDLTGRVSIDEGRHDEVGELAGTFDAMLDRLDRAFRAQRRFSAQVSHELRTPLAIVASEAELLLTGADASQRASLERMRAATDRAERIIGALLDLARSGSGDLHQAEVQLDVLTGDVLGDLVNGADWRRLRVELDLEAAPVRGDAALIERLVANLLTNAAVHNRPDGEVRVRTGVEGPWALLEVTNSSPRPPEGGDERWGDGRGGERGDGRPGGGRPRAGVGLTVVESVLTSHGGTLDWWHDDDAVTVTARLPRHSPAG